MDLSDKYEAAITRIKFDLSELQELVSEKRLHCEKDIYYYKKVVKELKEFLDELGENN